MHLFVFIIHAEVRCQKAGQNFWVPMSLTAYSAGTEKYHQVKPLAVQVMEEAGVDMSGHYPKLLEEIPLKVDILISMGCGVICPFVLCNYEEDWGIEDPSGRPLKNSE